MRIPCYLEFDDRTNVVTMRHAKTGCIQMQVKLELGCEGTMKRVVSNEDCDNWWIGVKPSDSTVTEDLLFSRKRMNVKSIDFSLEGS